MYVNPSIGRIILSRAIGSVFFIATAVVISIVKMPEEKKEWVVLQFPQGPFAGRVNVAINGEWVVSAQTIKEIMDKHASNQELTTTQN